jgi:sulfur carrier protein
MIKIKVNGEFREVATDIKVGTLLKELGIQEKTMASAVNMEVVKKENWDSYVIKDGDKVEFLHFVAGG